MLIVYAILTLFSTPTVPAPSVEANADLTVEEVVAKWAEASRYAGEIEGTFRVYKYDDVFNIETRGVGRYVIVSPRMWRVDLHPDPEIKGGEVHHCHGNEYTLVAHKDQTVSYSNGEYRDSGSPDFLEVMDTFEQQFKNGSWVFNWAETVAPLKLVMTPHESENLLEGHKIEFSEKKKSGIHLILYPTLPGLCRSYRKLEIILDQKSHLPNAVKMYDPSGNTETVFVFHNRKTNCDHSNDLFNIKRDSIR